MLQREKQDMLQQIQEVTAMGSVGLVFLKPEPFHICIWQSFQCHFLTLSFLGSTAPQGIETQQRIHYELENEKAARADLGQKLEEAAWTTWAPRVGLVCLSFPFTPVVF